MENAPSKKITESASGHRNLNSLVVTRNGEIQTTSLIIAEKFGMRHDNVLKKIERLDFSPAFGLLHLEVSTYMNEQGKSQKMYLMDEDGFSYLMMSFSRKAVGGWKEKFVAAFTAMKREILKQQYMRASEDWQNARLAGKTDRNALTDAVQRLALRAHDRQESTTPISMFEMSASRVVTGLLFDLSGEQVRAIRDRLTAKQLSRLALAEEIYANKILSLLGTDISHKAINLEAKQAVVAFVGSIGGRQVPGIDRLPMLAVTGGVAG